jgi:hypothetical protein
VVGRIASRVVLAGVVAGICCAATATSNGGSGSIPCELKLTYGHRTEGPPGQFHLALVFVNDDTVTNTACRVSGVPDVELIGPVYPMFGSIYTLPDQAGRTQSVILRAGETAHAVLTWLPSSSRKDRWVPGYVRVVVHTSRGPSFAMALPWRYGSVLRQDAATHPGTYVGPIRPRAG